MNQNLADILESPSYRKAFEDLDFLNEEDLRPIRLQLELLKPERIMNQHNIRSTIVVFGSARIKSPETAAANLQKIELERQKRPGDKSLQAQLKRARLDQENAKYYQEAQEFGRIVSTTCQVSGFCDFVVVTGGGPGVMEAANRGAHGVKAKSIGLTITLPREETPNEYITPDLCFRFRYFALRKMHLMMRARALVAFPGGFGTLDELFETLTLVQTGKVEELPILLLGKSFWQKLVNLEFLAEQGMIAEKDLELFSYVETAQEAWNEIIQFYSRRGQWPYDSNK